MSKGIKPKSRKSKGKRFENAVAATLTEWSGVELVRHYLSKPSDVVVRYNDEFPFVIECKNQQAWDFHNVFGELNGKMFDWVTQAIRQTVEMSKKSQKQYWPMLAFTANYKPAYVMVPTTVLPSGNISFTHMRLPILLSDQLFPFPGYTQYSQQVIMLLDDFTQIPYERVFACWEKSVKKSEGFWAALKGCE